MRAIVLHETGGPENLKLADLPVPVAGPGQVVIRTEAIGVSYTEAILRAGIMPPPVPLPVTFGFEAAGVVTETGDGIDDALLGRRVVVMNPGLGSYAEYVAAPAGYATEVPDGMSAADAAAVGSFGAVALCVLRAARLTGTETVLVEVAAGGVGGYLAQLARGQGAARIIATAGSPVKRDFATGLGADEVLDHTDPDWPARLTPGSVDVLFDSLGGDTTGKLLDAMTPGSGRILVYGLLQGPPTITALDLLTRGLTLTGCGGMPEWFNRVQATKAEVLRMAADGLLRPQIDSVLPLEDVVTAHQRFDDRAAIGKIIITP
jgi:NADPH:quinone reductase